MRKSGPSGRSSWGFRLTAETVGGDDRPVAFDVVGADVVQQSPPAPHQHQQATPAVMVLLVRRQVVVEVVDACGEQRDLDLGRPGVGVMELVVGDDGGLRRVELVGHACSLSVGDCLPCPVTRSAWECRGRTLRRLRHCRPYAWYRASDKATSAEAKRR